MKILHDALEHTLGTLPNEFLTQLILKKLSDRGIKLSQRERGLLAKQLLQGERKIFRLRRWHFWEQIGIRVEFTPTDIEQAGKKFTKFIETTLPDLISALADDLAQKILLDLKRKWRAESRRQGQETEVFSEKLCERWGLPIQGLKMMLTICREFGARVNDELREGAERESRKHLVEVLTRCHARSCQITQ